MNNPELENMVAAQFDNLWKFLPHTMAVHLSKGKWKLYPYLAFIGNRIAEAVARGNTKLIITAPPRHGKSELCSQWVPVWFLSNWPDKNVLLASYGAELATKFGRWCRNTLSENSAELGVQVSADSASVSRWHTTAGGSMVSLGVGGSVTGRGADLIVADDLIKNIADAQSPTLKANLRDWFKSTLFTRLEPGGCFVLVQTRWASDDLIGYLLDDHSQDWTEIRLPAIAEENDPAGRKNGEPLCPERFKTSDLMKIRDQIGPQLFDAMYQQNPSQIDSRMFKAEWWKYFNSKDYRVYDAIVQSWDCGFSKTVYASYSVCITVGIKDDTYYIIDVFRKRLEFPDLIKALKTNHLRRNPGLILIEAEASGRSLIQTLHRETQLRIWPVKLNNKSKQERAWEITHLIESGKVYLDADAEWLPNFLEEFSKFPEGRYSDQVDALTQALQFISTSSLALIKRERPSSANRPSTGRAKLYPDTYFSRNNSNTKIFCGRDLLGRIYF
jgi:predicted phage terminase large subunit-like protein